MASVDFAHIAIGCKDPIKVEKFYKKYLGFKRARVIPIGDNEQIVFIKLGNVYLELFQAKEESPVPPPEKDGPQYPGLRHLALIVNSVAPSSVWRCYIYHFH